ncbi:MAG: hypothetical protein U9Q99_00760 [Nanoarchaeota archaeon]|nr:hypothetical protein [Nanoarchaeota archaeon]
MKIINNKKRAERVISRENRINYKKYLKELKNPQVLINNYLNLENFVKGKTSQLIPIKASAIATTLMDKGYEIGDLNYSILAAKAYEKMGRGDNQAMLKRLNKTLKKSRNPKYQTSKNLIKETENFLKKHIIEEKTLEQRFLIPLFGIFTLAGIFFSSNMTGASIGVTENSRPFGIGLFLIGLVGLFISFIKK